jgi:AP-4 complex subunit beta-1
VLSLLSKYSPADEDEMFTIMNLLDPVLRTSNSGVVLAAIKCFIQLTRLMTDLHWQAGLMIVD